MNKTTFTLARKNEPAFLRENQGLNVKLSMPEDEGRKQLEAFVSDVFHKYYQAQIAEFYPCLLSVSTQINSLTAVAGIRSASEEKLFSEHYLSQPLMHYIKQEFPGVIGRRQIVEVGNLAPANLGQMRWLITALTAFLTAAKFKVVVFTGVRNVFNAFRRMGLKPVSLEAANLEKLPDSVREQWHESYYQHNPKVYLGDILSGADQLYDNICKHNPTLMPIWELSYQAGLDYVQTKELYKTFSTI